MDPIAPSDNTDNSSPSFLQKMNKIKFLIIAFLVVLVFITFYLILSKSSKNKKPEINPTPTVTQQIQSRVWEIVLSFNSKEKRLSVKNVSIKKGEAFSQSLKFTPYKLLVIDKNSNTIFKTDIRVTEEVVYNIYVSPGDSSEGAKMPPVSLELETLVSIPYLSQADKIQITKDDILILEFIPPKDLSSNLITKVLGTKSQTACNSLSAVFLSDGYSDMSKYHQDVENAKNAFLNIEPFSSKREIFDFKVIDNTTPLGCNNSGVLNVSCVSSASTISKVKNLVSTQFPGFNGKSSDYLKFIILADAAPQPMGGGKILGVTNGLGGDFAAFQNRQAFITTAVHEFEGHAVGLLYDRYVMSGYGSLYGSLRSNCTNQSVGEASWKQADSSSAGYSGCTNNTLFAPYQPTCNGGGSLISGGRADSLMSAGHCNASTFDTVEKYWLTQNILPQYCGTGEPSPSVTPSTTPTTTVSITPTSTPATTNNPTITSPAGITLSPSEVPPPVPYQCVEDQECIRKSNNRKSNLRICPLICTPI